MLLQSRALVALAVTEFVLRRMPLSRACTSLGVLPPEQEPSASAQPLTPQLRARIAQTVRCVSRASRALPLPNTCLRRSLTVGALLRDLNPALRIGVASGVTPGPSLQAHAWLEIFGNVVATDNVSTDSYRRLRRP